MGVKFLAYFFRSKMGFDVFCGSHQPLCVILEPTKTVVAVIAQQPPNLACFVAMVNMKFAVLLGFRGS